MTPLRSAFFALVLAACNGSAKSLDAPGEWDQMVQSVDAPRPILTLPIQFARPTAPALYRAGKTPPTEQTLDAWVQQTNTVWSPCDIQFTRLATRDSSWSSQNDFRPTTAEIDAVVASLYQQIGKPVGSAGSLFNFTFSGTLLAVAETQAEKLFGVASLDQLGRSSVPVVLDPMAIPSTAHARLSKEGLIDMYEERREGEPEDTFMISYGMGDPANGPMDLSQVHTLSHEVGHFLGLSHDQSPLPNLMGFAGTALLPYQCEIARATLSKKLQIEEQGCRARVESIVCEGTTCGQASGWTEPFLKLYDTYPPFLQHAMCGLKKIEVINNVPFTATTSPEGNKIYSIQVNSQFLSGKTTSEFFSEREARSFEPNSPATSLPHVTGFLRHGSDAAVAYFFTHELGHVIEDQLGLEPEWQKLTWVSSPNSSFLPLPQYDFPGRDSRCFFACAGQYMDLTAANTYFTNLAAKPFITSYATFNSVEDFAETFAFFVASEYRGATWSLVTPDGKSEDLLKRYGSAAFAAKRDFIRRAIAQYQQASP